MLPFYESAHPTLNFVCTHGSLSNLSCDQVHELQLDTEHTCGQCGVSCANLPGLRAHTRAHLAKRCLFITLQLYNFITFLSLRFLCANCNKSFLILSQLKDHVDKGVCTEENRRCNICSKVQKLYNLTNLHFYNFIISYKCKTFQLFRYLLASTTWSCT